MEDFLDGRGVNTVDLPIWYITHSGNFHQKLTPTVMILGVVLS